MIPYRFKYAWVYAIMPFHWLRLSCYDREAHVIAWKHAVAWAILGRGWRFTAPKRKTAAEMVREWEESRG